MRTLVVSDLHFGSVSGADVLREPRAAEVLLSELETCVRLVLLGDALELRHGPRRDALAAAKPFFSALATKMAGREILLVPGNHDHALVDSWMRRRAEASVEQPLALEQRLEPAEASSLAKILAEWCSPATLTIAYPGAWLRSDVYATHGHYLDCHLTVPTMERIAIAAMGKMLHKPESAIVEVDDYEAVCAPVYAWVDAVAAQGRTRAALNGSTTVQVWRALAGETAGDARDRLSPGMRRSAWVSAARASLSAAAVRRGFPLAVAGLNRVGLGPVAADVSGPALRRAGLRAIGEVAARLGIAQAHVVFGHTHRAGPLPGDDADEWRGRLGAKLVNCGSWTYSRGFGSDAPGESPYWPGGCVQLEGDRPPTVRRLLAGGIRFDPGSEEGARRLRE